MIARGLFVALLVSTLVTGASAQDQRRWSDRLAVGFQQLTAGRTDAAAAIFEEVATLAIEAHDNRSLGEARRGQARVLGARKDAAGMAAAYAEALKLFEAEGDARGIGQVRSDLGFAAWQRGDVEATRIEYTRAAEVFERAGLKVEHAGALRNITFSDIPRPERIALLERALVIASGTTDSRLTGLIHHALGDTLSADDDQQAALDHYEAALPLLERANDPAILARLLTSFGRLHRIHGDPAAALPYYERTIELVRPTADRDAERQAEDAISIALAWLGRYDEAVRHAERALTLSQEFRPVLAPLQQLLVAEMAIRAGDARRALTLLDSEQRTTSGQARRLIARTIALSMTSRIDDALVEADRAVAISATATWEEQIRAFDARSKAHEQAGHLSDATADAVQSVRVLENVRGGLVVSDAFRSSFSDGYRSFFDRAIELLAREGRGDEAFRVAETGRARALQDLIGSKTVTAVAAASSDDTTIAYWVTRSATHAWVTRSGTVIFSTRLAIGRDALDRLIGQSQSVSATAPRTAMRGGQPSAMFDHDPRPALRQLHETLFAPMRKAIAPAQRILIIPDGPLLGLSFAELIDRKGRYVVEDFTLRYAPSTALSAGRPRDADRVDSALLVSVSSGYPRSIGVTLSPLPGARREVDALGTLFPSASTLRVSDDRATEVDVRAAMKTRRVIHFATHAIVSSRRPEDSFLALRAGGGQDGRLTAGEILSMSIDADLVVLSACHGASGRVTGEGMLGLSRALLGAGARSLLASVRELPDETAAAMLPRFYRSWRASGDGAAALREAQLEQLRRLRSGQVRVSTPFGPITMPEHPSLWAGLVLIGGR